MKQKAVYDYVKKKRGLYAAEGGEVPEDDDSDDSDEDAPASGGKKKNSLLDDDNPFARHTGQYNSSTMGPGVSVPETTVKPQLYAAAGGEVPDDDGYYDSDQKAWIPSQPSGEDLADATPSPKGNPVDDIENGSDDDDSPEEAAAPAAKPAEPVDKQRQIQDYLKAKYDTAADDQNVKDAIGESKKQNLIANLGSAFEQMATSRAVANGMRPDDGSYWKGISAQGQRGVDMAVDARKQKIQGFLQQNEMNRQVAQDMIAKGTYEQKQQAADFLRKQNDPKSEYSISKVATLKQLHGAELGPTFDYSSISAADIPRVVADLHQTASLKNQKDNVRAKIEGNKEIAATRAQSHAEWAASEAARKGEAADARKEAGDGKIAQHQYDALAKDLDSQTATSRSGIGKANDKVNSADRLLAFAGVSPGEVDAAKKDPKAMAALSAKMDQMSPQKKAEMVQGLMAQISSGGGSLGQFEHLNAQTAGQTIANIKQYFTSHPEAANAGPMLVDNLMTLKNERDTSKAVIDEHAAKLRTKYPKAFSHPSTADDAKNMYEAWTGAGKEKPEAAPMSPPQGGPGMAIGAPAIPPVDAIEAEMARRKLKPKQGASGGF